MPGRVPDFSLSGLRVIRELEAIIANRGKPAMIVSDNGTELTSNAVLRWAAEHKIEWHYIAPGKPMQNAFVESFQQRTKPDHRASLLTFHVGKPETIMLPAENTAADVWIDEYLRFPVPDDETKASLDWLLDMLGAAFTPFAIMIEP